MWPKGLGLRVAFSYRSSCPTLYPYPPFPYPFTEENVQYLKSKLLGPTQYDRLYSVAIFSLNNKVSNAERTPQMLNKLTATSRVMLFAQHCKHTHVSNKKKD